MIMWSVQVWILIVFSGHHAVPISVHQSEKSCLASKTQIERFNRDVICMYRDPR